MIKTLIYNWFASETNGEQYMSVTIGHKYNERTCTKITEHSAMGEGDKWYYDIHYDDGSYQRVFNPNEAFFTDDINKGF